MSLHLAPVPPGDFVRSISRSHSWGEPLSTSPKLSNTSTTSLGTVHHHQDRRISPNSLKSATSTHIGPLVMNDENRDPPRPSARNRDELVGEARVKELSQSTSKQLSHKLSWGPEICVPSRSRGDSLLKDWGILDGTELISVQDNVSAAESRLLESRSLEIQQPINVELASLRDGQSVERIQPKRNDRQSHEKLITTTTPTDRSFRRWVQTLRRRKSMQPRVSTMHAPNFSLEDFGTSTFESEFMSFPRSNNKPSKRSSLASSAFIAGVTTATVSVESSSLFLGSKRNSTFSDPRNANRRSYLSNPDVRTSTESQPLAVNPLDEAAWERAVRRRQIIEEIVSSEESYIADLKALVNVFLTLLASTPALTNKTRKSIENNALQILQMHEDLLRQLQQAVTPSQYQATHEGPRKRHVRWQSLDLTSSRRRLRNGHKKRSSISVSGASLRESMGFMAEPSVAARVARIFKGMITQFFAYEEYSAKYEMMVQDVASTYKSVSGWQSYEMGIEALAASLTSINNRDGSAKKGLTFSDLLIKPIQRVCKYPLFFADLLKHTPVFDCPESHEEIERLLICLRETVREINKATDDRVTRERIQRTWLLQDKLRFSDQAMRASIFRDLGHSLLCGVLHVAYQTRFNAQGEYMVSALFKSYFILARPNEDLQEFHVVAYIHVADLKIESTEDGKGIQCHTAPYSWKIVFESDNRLFEFILSACSAREEHTWKSHLLQQTELEIMDQAGKQPASRGLVSTSSLDLKSAGQIFGQPGTLARRLSIQRAATVGTKSNIYQIIIKNTHLPNDCGDPRYPLSPSMNRSQSLLATHRITILAPKRSERIRLEQSLVDIWSKELLPYPGMIAARGEQLKKSANSVMRKLNLASISAPFTRRSTSLTTLHRSASHAEGTVQSLTEEAALGLTQDRTTTILDEADVAVEDGHKKRDRRPASRANSTSSSAAFVRIKRSQTLKFGNGSKKSKDSPRISTNTSATEETSKEKKRWSNPIGMMKNLQSDGIKGLFA